MSHSHSNNISSITYRLKDSNIGLELSFSSEMESDIEIALDEGSNSSAEISPKMNNPQIPYEAFDGMAKAYIHILRSLAHSE